MKLTIVSDIHLGKYKYGKINNKTGLDLRTEDIIKNLDETIEFSIEKKVDGFIITGDFYHNKRPFQIFRKLIASRINKLLQNKIEVFLLLGNHDQGKTSGHDLIELSEVSEQIQNLHIIDKPSSFELKESLLCFLPCVNKIDYQVENEFDFNIENIKNFTKKAIQSNKKYKMFFGHFGTDHSIAGKSFDLGTVVDQESKHIRIVSLNEFNSKAWSFVYLGDIHKAQELNDFCFHVGSIARVDFSEEFEQKSFCFFEDGLNKIIKLHDREFKTLEVNLIKNPRGSMETFCNEVQDLDLSQTITRMKIKIKTQDRQLVSFNGLEEYLRESSWNYIGKTITEISDEKEDVVFEENEELNHLTVFTNYLESMKGDLEEGIFDEVKKQGIEILSEVLNS